MDAFVEGATDKALAQRQRQSIKGFAIARADAPGAAEYELEVGIRLQEIDEDGKPLEEDSARCLFRAHVDASFGVDVDGLMVHNTVQVQIQGHVRTF